MSYSAAITGLAAGTSYLITVAAVSAEGAVGPEASLSYVPGRRTWGHLPETVLLTMQAAVARLRGSLRTVSVNGSAAIPADFRLAGAAAGEYGMSLGTTNPVCYVTSGQFCDLGITTGARLVFDDGRTYYVIADDPITFGFCRLQLSEDNPL